MTITFNGKKLELDQSLNLDQLLEQNQIDPKQKGMALCLNLDVLPQNLWSETQLKNHDRIDLVIAAPGG